MYDVPQVYMHTDSIVRCTCTMYDLMHSSSVSCTMYIPVVRCTSYDYIVGLALATTGMYSYVYIYLYLGSGTGIYYDVCTSYK